MQEHDPFTFGLNEIRAHDAGRRHWPVGERDRRLDQLLAEEAQELAWGRRHLTVIYGDILTEADEHDLDDLVCTILDAFAPRWFRLTGVPDRYLTVTIAGDDATQVIHALAGSPRLVPPDDVADRRQRHRRAGPVTRKPNRTRTVPDLDRAAQRYRNARSGKWSSSASTDFGG